MKKLNISKNRFNKSKYFTSKYGKLEYVSESGRIYKTSSGHILKFIKESDSGFNYNAKDMLAQVTDMDELYDTVKSDCEDLIHSAIIKGKYDESLFDEKFMEDEHQKIKDYIWGAVGVHMNQNYMNRKFGTITSKGRKFHFIELNRELFEPGYIENLDKSVMDKFKAKVKNIAFLILNNNVMRNAEWFISHSIQKYAMDKKESKILDNIDEYIKRIEQAKDKVDEYSNIMHSFGEISYDGRNKIKNILLNCIVNDLLKNNSLEELADEWFKDYGTMNGWDDKQSAKYDIACKIHQEHMKKHPDEHRKLSQRYDWRGWHEDNCSCGLSSSSDSSD